MKTSEPSALVSTSSAELYIFVAHYPHLSLVLLMLAIYNRQRFPLPLKSLYYPVLHTDILKLP